MKRRITVLVALVIGMFGIGVAAAHADPTGLYYDGASYPEHPACHFDSAHPLMNFGGAADQYPSCIANAAYYDTFPTAYQYHVCAGYGDLGYCVFFITPIPL